LNDRVPDEKTVWDFKERLCGLELEEELFKVFHVKLEENGLIAHEGKIVDASFVEMPCQRNSREENKHIKQTGTAPESWDTNPHKKRQKDVDGRWTKKNGQNHYGYKDHVKVDSKHKFIDKYRVTPASVHDSQPLEELLDQEKDKDKGLWADSAYTGEEQERVIQEYGMINHVHEKGYKNKPLTDLQKESNREKSKTRARVEHVFGFIEGSMNKFYLHCIGIRRVSTAIGLINLTYNLFRYEQLVRLHGITMSNC
jgi:transposase, IS5 family